MYIYIFIFRGPTVSSHDRVLVYTSTRLDLWYLRNIQTCNVLNHHHHYHGYDHFLYNVCVCLHICINIKEQV